MEVGAATVVVVEVEVAAATAAVVAAVVAVGVIDRSRLPHVGSP